MDEEGNGIRPAWQWDEDRHAGTDYVDVSATGDSFLVRYLCEKDA